MKKLAKSERLKRISAEKRASQAEKSLKTMHLQLQYTGNAARMAPYAPYQPILPQILPTVADYAATGTPEEYDSIESIVIPEYLLL